MISDNKAKIETMAEQIGDSQTKIRYLEKELEQVQSHLAIKEIVIQGIQGEVRRLQQYTRRYSVIISGIEKTDRRENVESLRPAIEDIIEKVNSTTTAADIDKFHRNGPLKGNRQEIILRFKSHASKEAFYKARKTLPETMQHIKIRPSLSVDQQRFLDKARDIVDDYKLVECVDINPPDFVFADINGDIMLKMKKKMKSGMFIKIRNITHLCQVLTQSQMKENSYEEYDRVTSWADVSREDLADDGDLY